MDHGGFHQVVKCEVLFGTWNLTTHQLINVVNTLDFTALVKGQNNMRVRKATLLKLNGVNDPFGLTKHMLVS